MAASPLLLTVPRATRAPAGLRRTALVPPKAAPVVPSGPHPAVLALPALGMEASYPADVTAAASAPQVLLGAGVGVGLPLPRPPMEAVAQELMAERARRAMKAAPALAPEGLEVAKTRLMATAADLPVRAPEASGTEAPAATRPKPEEEPVRPSVGHALTVLARLPPFARLHSYSRIGRGLFVVGPASLMPALRQKTSESTRADLAVRGPRTPFDSRGSTRESIAGPSSS